MCKMEAKEKLLKDMKDTSKDLQDKIDSKQSPSTNDVILQRHLKTKIEHLESEAKVGTQ